MLKVNKPGFYTSLQDLGRYGFRHLGVPVSGALHSKAVKRANALLENDPNDAVLEITMNGPDLEFTEPTIMVLCGGQLQATLNGETLEMNQVYQVPSGAVFESGHIQEGLRTYLAIKGGFRTEFKLGSRSQFYPITDAGHVKKGTLIPYEPHSDFSPKLLKISAFPIVNNNPLIVSPGPEYKYLEQIHLDQLFNTDFQISKNHNRMACQLEPTLEGHEIRMITSATLPGTIQITPSGRLIILLRDGQTTGGYPRILQLDADSQDLVGQKQYGDSIRFQKFDGF